MSIRTVVKKIVPKNIFKAIEPLGHLLEAVVFNVVYRFPGRDLKVIGVTGTNGKTSTSFIIHKMLVDAGYNAALMTTVAWGINNDIKPQVQHMTTVGVPVLMKRLRYLRNKQVDWLVLEVTSHALAQHRIWGVPISVAVMTNLTHEHLDYHGTFENYRDAKRRLFKMANRNKKGLRTGIVNADDPNAALFAKDVLHPLTYGVENADLSATNIELSPDGVQYDVSVVGENMHITCKLPGSFNVYNSLAAVGVGQAIGLSVRQVERGIAALEGVEGRMTRVDEGQDFSVIVDYAHTPDSFEKLFKDLKPVVKGKLLVMFGSAGRRDAEKRAVQGHLAGKYADLVVITEEDDRDIDGLEIMNEIAEGAEKAGKTREKDLFLVHDREQAIISILKKAKKNDTVLLLGKGHEKDILRNGPRAAELRHLQQDDHNPDRVVEIPWDEIATTKRYLHEK
jgi:UDP-N-acetylmuramoyl-L-alanyl-D-glutamate--2,6-diaminopimelate ligase